MIDVMLVMARGVRDGKGPACSLAVVACGALLVGCAATSTSAAHAHASSARASTSALAARVCGNARQAAARALGSALAERVASGTAADLKCVLAGPSLQVTIESQTGPRAYTEFDTETSHQSQVYGNGGAHNPAQDPVQITVPGSQVAVWIPAQRMVVTTNATPANDSVGAYVTVTVSGHATAKTALSIATAAATATFAAHPEGSA